MGEIHWPPPGRYLLAVSGGADSMTLLHVMANAASTRRYELILAHFDHGLRHGSAGDRRFVQTEAARYNLPFVYTSARLGQGSEATARSARHAWLEQTRGEHGAGAVVTAHHQDDLVETSLLNLARGSGRRGLAPMASGPIVRPLMGLTREQIRAYAQEHKIGWREDPTNADTSNPRNFLRHLLLPAAPPEWARRYLELLEKLSALNNKTDQTLAGMLAAHVSGDRVYSLPRQLVRDLSPAELEELITAACLRLRPNVQLERRVVQEVALFAKTSAPHRRRPVRDGLELTVSPHGISVMAV